MTECHRVGETAGVVHEPGTHRADGVATAEAKPVDIGFVEIVRLKCEQKSGVVAPLGIRGVMRLDDRLHPTQGSGVGKEVRKAQFGAKRLAWGADGWGAAGGESTETAGNGGNSWINWDLGKKCLKHFF